MPDRAYALVIPPDGDVQVIDEPIDWGELQRIVGGDIEAILLPHAAAGLLNENGKALELELNDRATTLLRGAGGIPDDWIAGPFIVVGAPDDEGNDMPVPDVWLSLIDELERMRKAAASISLRLMVLPAGEVPQSRETFVHATKESVEATGRDFTHPDEDWDSMLILQTQREVMVADLAPLMRDEDSKDLLGYVVMPALVRRARAIRTAFVSSVWTVLAQDGPIDVSVPASESPQRREAVHVFVQDAKGWEMWLALIKRRRIRPPLLHPWKMLASSSDAEQDAGASGRMWESVRQAILDVDEQLREEDA